MAVPVHADPTGRRAYPARGLSQREIAGHLDGLPVRRRSLDSDRHGAAVHLPCWPGVCGVIRAHEDGVIAGRECKASRKSFEYIVFGFRRVDGEHALSVDEELHGRSLTATASRPVTLVVV